MKRLFTQTIKFRLMLFRELAEVCESLASTTKRSEMVRMVADFLACLEPEEVEPASCMLLGRPFPKTSRWRLDVSWATLAEVVLRITGASQRELAAAFDRTGDVGAATAILFHTARTKHQQLFLIRPLLLLEVHEILRKVARLSGPGARRRRERLIEGLLNRCEPLEAKYLVKIVTGEMRTGFQEGLMELAVARAFGVPFKAVRRAVMFAGDIAVVAGVAAKSGEAGIKSISPSPMRPISPMLAQVCNEIEEAIEAHGGTTNFEYKLDGARVQIHKRRGEIRIFSRRLSDVTESLPEIKNLVLQELRADEAIVEGEVIAVGKDGQPLPFQSLLQRFRREREVERVAKEIPVRLQLFDLLYLDGRSLVDCSYEERRERLKTIVGDIELTEQLTTSRADLGKDFLERALRAGHEGLMAKKPGSAYVPGVRGKLWLKIKPILEPLDLVIVGAEFGYGRRHRWLSDYYLAARDENTGKFEIIGKTFKGLTDEEIKEMTRELQKLVIRQEGRRVWVLPKMVVEIAYNEIQRSPKYPSGMALRFARIIRLRPDKSPIEADTIQRVRGIFERQVKRI
ncbi:MAG: ATP-dependent DNA ligase [Candidatus Hadarchaeum sp.]|uniref:ATP-dependent DNA ligase n=2 Tax=Candidatus Hadarchaeum sp. TaxID=2883567 RepID=UPI003171A2F7